MKPREKPYIYYRGRKYRDSECRLENTYGEGDYVPVVDAKQRDPVVDAEQEAPMADDDGKRFADMLLKSVQDLSTQIEVMGHRFTVVEARERESPRVFQIGEGSGASHHLPEQRDTTQQVASHSPTCSTMHTFLGADTGATAQ